MRIIVNCFVLLISVSVFCINFNVVAGINDNSLQRLSVENGLPQNTILTLAQDHQGYIWIGTSRGVSVYDGYRVSSIKGPDNDFDKFQIDYIFVARDGFVWISVLNKGLYRFDPKLNHYQLIMSLQIGDADSNIWKIKEDIKNKRYWFISQYAIYNYDLEKKQIINKVNLLSHQDFDSSNRIYNFEITDDYIFVTADKYIFTYDLQSHVLYSLPLKSADVGISPTLMIKEKYYDIILLGENYYFGTSNGVFSFSKKSLNNFIQGLAREIVYKEIIPDIDVWHFLALGKQLYIGTSNGLYRYDTLTDHDQFIFKFSDSINTVANNSIIALIADHSNRIWLGSQTSGLYFWDPETELITNYTYDSQKVNTLSSDSVNSIVVMEGEQLWAGTSNGLNFIDLKNHTIEQYLVNNDKKIDESKSLIYHVKKDYLNRLWLATADGIHIFDAKKLKLIIPDFPESTKQLLAIGNQWASINSIDENIWLVLGNDLYMIHAKTGVTKKLENLGEITNERYIWHVMPSFNDNKNEVLISCGDSLWLYNYQSNQSTLVFKQNGINKGAISFVDNWVKDSEGILWLSYPQVGVIGIDAKNYQQRYFFNVNNSLLDLNVSKVHLDKKDNLWVSSEHGIYQINSKTKHIKRYSQLDGLVSSEFNFGASLQLSDGRLAYGSVEGMSVFDPDILGNKQLYKAPQAHIVNVSTLSRKLELPMYIVDNYQVELNQDDVGIRIDFSHFLFGANQKSVFKYGLVNEGNMLESTQNYASFTHLSPGLHTFSVQVKSLLTGQYSDPKFIKLNVAYAPLRSPLAYGVYMTLVFLLIALWLRARHVKRMELLAAHEQVQQREKRLELALSAGNTEVWDWVDEDQIFVAKRYQNDLYFDNDIQNMSFNQHIELIHPNDKTSYISKWQNFLTLGDAEVTFECIYRLRTVTGRWLWYRDLGKIVEFNKKDHPSRVTGSYNNITESKANEERSLCYGAAFEQTHDWVLIFDETFEIARANKAMMNAYDWQDEEFELDQGIPGISQEKITYYLQQIPKAIDRGSYREEEIITVPNGQKFHVITNITVSVNDRDKKKYFICVFTDITKQKKAENELRVLANYDHLTGLPNRSLILERIDHAIAIAERQEKNIALFFIDLDGFKRVNDTLGHEYGDLLLQQVANRLKSTIREEDTIARIGGDEFVVLIENYKINNDLTIIAQKLVDAAKQPFDLKDQEAIIGSSIGISIYSSDAKSSDELFRNADAAMYHVKQSGKNNFQFYTESLNHNFKLRKKKEKQLKYAVTHNRIFNMYQPIIDSNTGNILGAELLMRIQDGDEILLPEEFIALADETGLIVEMTKHAIEEGLQKLEDYFKSDNAFYLSVNISLRYFENDSLFNDINQLLQKYHLSPSILKIEITESIFQENESKAIAIIKKLHKLGIRFSLDNFGNEFSSLSYIKQLPFDMIKIDLDIIKGIGVNNTDEAIIDASLVLAKRLNVFCIAKGVETQEQLDYLGQQDCFTIQGYLYYHPLTAKELKAKLVSSEIGN